ncbi:MAG: histidine triad nucleotide-binding protein [Calditrichaeota bacterium]|nr:MAG: histidine triad nucleotide-binding protein [Calditrichota bacterium]
MNCLFCKIAEKKLVADIIYEDDDIIAFRDISPQAPVHVLIIPRIHIATLNDLAHDQADLLGQIILRAKSLAAELGCGEKGYRLVMNCNHDGGQSVFHLHCHLLGGRQLYWPPG